MPQHNVRCRVILENGEVFNDVAASIYLDPPGTSGLKNWHGTLSFPGGRGALEAFTSKRVTIELADGSRGDIIIREVGDPSTFTGANEPPAGIR